MPSPHVVLEDRRRVHKFLLLYWDQEADKQKQPDYEVRCLKEANVMYNSWGFPHIYTRTRTHTRTRQPTNLYKHTSWAGATRHDSNEIDIKSWIVFPRVCTRTHLIESWAYVHYAMLQISREFTWWIFSIFFFFYLHHYSFKPLSHTHTHTTTSLLPPHTHTTYQYPFISHKNKRIQYSSTTTTTNRYCI